MISWRAIRHLLEQYPLYYGLGMLTTHWAQVITMCWVPLAGRTTLASLPPLGAEHNLPLYLAYRSLILLEAARQWVKFSHLSQSRGAISCELLFTL